MKENDASHIICPKCNKPLKTFTTSVYSTIVEEFVHKSCNKKILKIIDNDKSISIPDIRNKLSPICNLIALLESDKIKDKNHPLILQSIEQSKISIKYLSGKDM